MSAQALLSRVLNSAGRRVPAAAVLIFCCAFFVRAQVSDARLRVTFPFDKAEVRQGYMTNAGALAVIDSLLAGADSSAKVEIVTYSSPEGPEAYNLKLSRLRAASMADYVRATSRYVAPTFRIISYSESWAQFRDYIASDSSLSASDRQSLLDIVDSDRKLDDKEALIKANPNYKSLYRKYFRSLRYADVSLRVENRTIVPIPRLELVRTKVFSQDRPDSVRRTEPADSTMSYEPLDSASTAWPELARVPVIALHNNFLAEAATVGTGFHTVPLAVGVEVPLGGHWSLYGDYLSTVPWHAWNGNADCVELMHWGLGARWYPGTSFRHPFTPSDRLRVLEGWYASLSAHMGYYDFELRGRGWQGEEAAVSMGLGYSLCFDEHWSINFGIAFGPMYTAYRYYEGRNNNSRLVYQYPGHLWYFGPTDARISLTYLIYAPRRK